MQQNKVNFIWFIVSITSYALMSASLLLIPLDKTIEYDAMDIVPGVMFWLFLVLGIIGQIVLSARYKRFVKFDKQKKGQKRNSKIGLLSFFKNIPAIIADVGFVIGLMAFVIAMKVTEGLGNICYVFLAVCIFSFCAHCIFNGKIFRQITE